MRGPVVPAHAADDRPRRALGRRRREAGEGHPRGDGRASPDGRFEVFGEDGFNRTVQFTPSVDGMPVAGLQTNIAFGADARIEYANGLLAEVEALGEYPLIGLADAVERLEEGFGSGGVRTMGAPETDIATDPAATSDAAGAAEGGASSGGGTSGSAGSSAGSTGSAGAGVAEDVSPPQPTCAPGEPCTSPPSPPKDQPPMTIEPPDRATPTVPLEPQVIEITGAELSLQLVAAGCPGDPVYLVPAFDLLPGPAASVIAVEDDAIAGAGSDEPGTAQPCPDLPTSDLPAGKPEPAPMPADSGGATEPAPLPADAGREPARP